MLRWNKKGLIIKANQQREWMHSHIQNPCVIELENCIRVYFSTRPKPQEGLFKSVIAFVDLDKTD